MQDKLGGMMESKQPPMEIFDRRMREALQRVAALEQKAGDSDAVELRVVAASALQELQSALEELRVADEELHQQNEALLSAREALEEERRRYADLFQFAPDAYLVTTLDGAIREANQAATELFNLPLPLLIGKPVITFVALDERAAFRTTLRLLQEQNRIEDWEVQFKPRASALTIPVALSVAVDRDRDGTAVALRWLMRDISDRRRAEAERYQQLVEEIADYAIFLMDPQGIVLSWNRGAELIFQFTAEEAVGQYAGFIFTPEDRERGVPEKERATAARDGRAADERWHLRKDDSRFYASGVMISLRRRDGSIGWIAKVLRDLTERRRSEVQAKHANQQLRVAHEELEARVVERTADLHRTNTLLEREVRERTQAELSRRELTHRLVSAQEEERRRISRELHDEMGQHLTAFALGLKAFKEATIDRHAFIRQVSRLQQIADEMGREIHRMAVELRPTALDDLGLYTTLVNHVEEWAQETGLEVDFHSVGLEGQPEEARLPPEIETTAYRIVQEALTNILRHANAKRVSVILERRAEQIIAIVEDDGQGFDPDADVALLSGRIGVLGMRERAAQVGGVLSIESAPGEGVTVFLRIPLKLETQEEGRG